MKKLVSLVLVLAVLFSFPAVAYASESDSKVSNDITYLSQDTAERYEGLTYWYPMLRWSVTQSVINGMILNGTSATVVCDVQAYSTGTKITATNTLQRYSGSSWVNVRSWTGSGTFYCAFESRTTLSGGERYRVVTTAKLYDAKGNHLETVTVNSNTYYC